jgi:predicted peptidase
MSDARLLRISRMSAATGAERDFFLYLPRGFDAMPEQRWPVLLFLHGNGERGDAKSELDYVLKNGPLYEAWIQKRDLPFVIAVPQLPMYGRDAHADYLRNRSRAEIPVRLAQGTPPPPPHHPTYGPLTGVLPDANLPDGPEGPPMGWWKLETDLIDILDHVLAHYRGDPARQYLSGISYGGFGTWHVGSRHPERFAALLPVVGYPHPEHALALARAKTPIWCIAGGRDQAVPLRYFYPGLNRLEELGHRCRFSIEADLAHDVWTRVYAGGDVYAWLLGQVRAEPGLSARR